MQQCNKILSSCTKQFYIKHILIVFLETVFIKFHEIIIITSSSVQNNRDQDKSYQPQPLASVDNSY